MPALKAYTAGSGHYIHASVRGAVVTFQTTKRGVEKLTAAGVQSGARFALRLLADLTRTGDAYTHHGGVEFYEADQFEFDFKESQGKYGKYGSGENGAKLRPVWDATYSGKLLNSKTIDCVALQPATPACSWK